MMTHSLLMTNKKGIVVATDNTLILKNGAKIKNVQQKLFSISERHPIAIMSLGNTFFVNAPLETIIKQFAATINDTFYNQATDYVDHFISFIEEIDMIDMKEEIEEENYIISFINKIIEGLHRNLIAVKSTHVGQLEKATHMEEMEYYLQKELNRLVQKAYLDSFTADDYEEIDDTYKDKIAELIYEEISDENVANTFINTIKDIAIQALLKDILPHTTSIVFVGFGQLEINPTICELHIEGRVNRKLKFAYKLDKMTIEDVGSGKIKSFGRTKLPMYSFMESIDLDLEMYLSNDLHNQLRQAKHNILNSIVDESGEIENLLNETFSNILDGVKEDFSQYKQDYSVLPIVQNIQHLSLEQLAYHAESLLHLSELKGTLNNPEHPLAISSNVATIDRVEGFTLVK